MIGLEFHLACRQGDAAEARRRLVAYRQAVSSIGVADAAQLHDLLTAALSAGLGPAEMRPSPTWPAATSVTACRPTTRGGGLLDAQLRPRVAPPTAAGRGGCRVAGPGPRGDGRPPRHRPRGNGPHADRRGRLDEARVQAEAAAPLLARWRAGGSTSWWRSSAGSAWARPPSGPDALTPREREVARLLAEGLSNSQLAERLYISPRTAAVHVSNILSKLGASSRTEVAAWAVRDGLASDRPARPDSAAATRAASGAMAARSSWRRGSPRRPTRRWPGPRRGWPPSWRRRPTLVSRAPPSRPRLWAR